MISYTNSSSFTRITKVAFEASSFPFEIDKSQSMTPFVSSLEDEGTRTRQMPRVHFVTDSAGVMPAKPAMLLEEILLNEQWYGRVIAVESKAVIADLYNVAKKEQRLILRINKEKINSVDTPHYGMALTVTIQRIRDYQGIINQSVTIRSLKAMNISDEIFKEEYQERVNRFSYMFRKDQ